MLAALAIAAMSYAHPEQLVEPAGVATQVFDNNLRVVDMRQAGLRRALLDLQTRTFKSADDLKQIYKDRGILPSNEVIACCQVGMRASVDLFALHLIGFDKLRSYYSAWEEWGNRDDLPLGKK